jgi:hypothetical protein
MNDERKTKKGLIAELEALRRQIGADISGAKCERAGELIRAEVASMRSGEDLVKVVALVRREMVRLGIDTHLVAIGFIDGETHLVRWCWAMDGLRRYGMRAAEVLPPGLHLVGEDHVKILSTGMEVPYLIPVWQSGQPYTYKRDTGDGSWLTESMGFREMTADFIANRPYQQYNTDVPFEHGVVSFVVQEPKDEYVEIVRELTQAVSLGYIRFLDFQKVDQTQRQLIDALEESNATLEAELQKAHDLQMGLMPTAPPAVAGFGISGRCIPASHVGGDFFQYFPRDGQLSICMADVTGQRWKRPFRW